MFYPAENLDGHVNNISGDQQYPIDWNEIEHSYSNTASSSLETGTWMLKSPLHSCTAMHFEELGCDFAPITDMIMGTE